jgi:hypothetical protein
MSPNYLFSFEFIEYLSEIDKLHKSNNYSLLNTYDSLRLVQNEEYFSINSCTLLTIEPRIDYKQNRVYEIYVADDLQQIHKIVLNNLNIIESNILNEIMNNRILMVTLKNVSLVKNKIQLSQFSLIEKSPLEQVLPIDALFRSLDNLFHLYDFVKINGRVLSILNEETTQLLVSLSVKEVKQIVKIRLNKLKTRNLIVVDKIIGPVLGFIYELNKNTIFVKELYLL